MSTPLLITPDIAARIAEVKAYGEAHRLDFEAMKRYSENRRPFEDLERREVFIPFGFKLVYNIEQQPEPLGWCHHFSMSSGRPDADGKSRQMHPAVCVILVEAFGVKFPGWDQCAVYHEDESPRRPVHILVPFSSQPEKELAE